MYNVHALFTTETHINVPMTEYLRIPR